MNSVVNEKNFIAPRVQGAKYANLSQSYLRAETALGTTSIISFDVQRNNVTAPTATERLLEQNDKFVITHLGVALKQIGADSPTAAQHAAARLYNWENPQVFTGTNAANVDTIWNGSLRFTIDRKQYIPNLDVRSFRRVPETQENTETVSSGTATTPTSTYYAAGRDSFPNGLYGMWPLDPTVITGTQTLDIDIDLGTSIAFDDASNSVYAVLILKGYLVVNSVDVIGRTFG